MRSRLTPVGQNTAMTPAGVISALCLLTADEAVAALERGELEPSDMADLSPSARDAVHRHLAPLMPGMVPSKRSPVEWCLSASDPRRVIVVGGVH